MVFEMLLTWLEMLNPSITFLPPSNLLWSSGDREAGADDVHTMMTKKASSRTVIAGLDGRQWIVNYLAYER